MLNKRVLNEVLYGNNFLQDISLVGTVMKHNNCLQYSTEKGHHVTLNKHINIYELVHKCKEWILKQEDIQSLDIHIHTTYCLVAVIGQCDRNEDGSSLHGSDRETEKDAIFEVTQLVYDNSKKG